MENELPKRKNLRLRNYDYSATGAYFVTICIKDRKRILSEIGKPNLTSTSRILDSDAVGEGLDPPANERFVFCETGAASYSPTSFDDRLNIVLDSDAVGEGLDPPANERFVFCETGAASYSPTSFDDRLNIVLDSDAVGEGLDPPENEGFMFDKTGAASYSPTSFQKYLRFVEYPEMRLKKIGEIAVEQLFALEKRFPNVEINEYAIMPDHIHAIIRVRKNEGESSPSPALFDIMRVYKSLTSRICKQKYGIEKLFQRSYIEHVIRDRDDYEIKRKYIYENPIRWYYENLESDK